jgi:putative transposase
VDEMRAGWKVSVRRACRVLRFDPKSYRYRSRRPGQAALEDRIRTICQTRVRYGYRRVHVLLRREGWVINEKRTRRVYNEIGMQLRNKTPKRRVKAALRADRTPPSRSNEVWAMDFVHDQLAMGTKLRILTVIDTFSRYVPVVDPRLAYRGADVVATLERACKEMGYPSAIRVDQGSEFVSRDLDLWAYQNNVTLDFSRPGKPTDNAFIEAFNGRLRAECLNTHWFLSVADARAKLEDWRRDYNEVRPHGAIGNKPPAALLECIGVTSPSMPKETGKSTLR